MDIALEHALQRDYPALYSDCRESHFWCEDGWYPLLRALSQAVETYCQENDIGIHVTQVKQKFGTLRYYHGYDSTLTDAQGDELSKIVDDYCDRSRRICEKCGLPGTLLVSGAYWHVACPEHADGGLTPGVFQQLQEAKFKRRELPPEGPLAARRLPADPKQDASTYRRFVAIRLAHYAEEMAEARTNCHRADGSAPVLHYLAGSIGSGKTLLSAPLRRQLGIAESAWVDVDRYLPSLPKDHARLVTIAREAIRQWLPGEDDADRAMGLIPAANEPLPELQVAYLLSNADWRRGLDARQNLLVETTFSLAGRFDQVLESIRAGAVVDLDYVGVHDLDTLVRRVQSRALGGDRVDIPEAQIERNLFSGFTHAALVAHLARRLRVYDNRATVDLNLQADYQPPLLLEIERGVILRQSAEPLPWWAEILRDVALGADMGVDMDALYH